jgi:hypothetical protein
LVEKVDKSVLNQGIVFRVSFYTLIKDAAVSLIAKVLRALANSVLGMG